MSVLVNFRIEVTDVKKLAFDIDEEAYFIVEGKDFDDVNQQIDDIVRSFLAFNNIDDEDKVKVIKFI